MLQKSAKSVQEALSSQGVDLEVKEFPASTRTADDAAKAIGCQVGQIVKSLVFCTKQSKQGILLLVSGANRVNEKNIAKEIGEEIVKADADFVRDKTGFAIGGIPPVGHKELMPTYIDEDLMQYEELWAAAGTPHAVFRIGPQQLCSLTQGTIISIK
jgi:Cys-tRNA(Pro) deacylase